MHLLSSRKLTLFLFPKIESFDSLETWEFVKFPSCHGSSIREEKEISSWTQHGWIVDGQWSSKKEEKRRRRRRDFLLTQPRFPPTRFSKVFWVCNVILGRSRGRRKGEGEGKRGARDKETTKRLSLRDVSLASSRGNIFRNARCKENFSKLR